MRAPWLCVLVAACAVETSSTTTELTISDVWQQLGFGAAHTGVNPNETVLAPATVDALDLAWEATTGLTPGGAIVASGRAYVGSENNTLYAFDATTGRRVWRAFAGNDIAGTPAAAYGYVYFVSNDGYLYAVAGRTGALAWRASVRPYPTAPVDSRLVAPVLHGGNVYVAVSHRLFVFAAEGCGAATCTPRWYADVPIMLNGWQAPPAIGKGHVYVVGAVPDASDRVALHAFPLAGCAAPPCRPTWVRTLVAPSPGYVLPYTLVYNGGRVYVTTDVAIFSVYADTGVVRWRRDLFCTGAPAIAGGVVYVPTFDGLVAIQEANVGRTIWRSAASAGRAWTPAIANGVVYAGIGDAGRLSAFAIGCGSGGATCAPLWTDDVAGTRQQPVITGGMVFVSNAQANTLRALAP